MPVIIDYILKLSICLAVVYLFYQLFLRRLTFYNWNRWYFLAYSTLAFIIPLIDIMPELQRKELDQNAFVQLIPSMNFVAPAGSPSILETLTVWDWVSVAAVLGSVILMIRFAIMYISFLRIKKRAQLISNDATKIYQLDEDIRPFSFGSAIFINTELHSGEELEEIIRHEFVHVKQKHTIDIVWSEFLCIVLWFNPFVWLLRKAIKQNLEFVADRKVLQNGIDKKEYQYLLLKVMGNKEFAFATHFNFSSLKNRIVMMNRLKSAKLHLTKFLFLLPVVAVLLLSFRKEVMRIEEKKATGRTVQKNGEHIFKKAMDVAGNSYTAQFSTDRMRRKEALKKDTIPGVVIIGKSSVDSARFYSSGNSIVIRSASSENESPLIIVDGVRLSKGEGLEQMDPSDIQSFSVLKGASAKTEYGEEGENGVIIVTTKGHKTSNSHVDRMVIGRPISVDEQLKNALTLEGKVEGVKIENATSTFSPLPLKGQVTRVGIKINDDTNKNRQPFNGIYVVDGKEANSVEIGNLNPQSIKAINVFKSNPKKEQQYGEKAKNGVIEIETRGSDTPEKSTGDVVVAGYGVRKSSSENLKPVKLDPVIVRGYRSSGAQPSQVNSIVFKGNVKGAAHSSSNNGSENRVMVLTARNGKVRVLTGDDTIIADTIFVNQNKLLVKN